MITDFPLTIEQIRKQEDSSECGAVGLVYR